MSRSSPRSSRRCGRARRTTKGRDQRVAPVGRGGTDALSGAAGHQSNLRRHQSGDQFILAERLGQCGRGLRARFQSAGIAGGHDNANAPIVEPHDQLVGALARTQMQIDHGCVGTACGNQPIGVRSRRDRPGDFGPAGAQQACDRDAQIHRILDDQDVQTGEVGASRLGNGAKVARGRSVFRGTPPVG